MAVLPPDPVFAYRNTDMGAINCICFHRAERLIAGTAAGAVYLLDLQTNRVAHHFQLPTVAAVNCVQKHDETLHTQQRGGAVAAWTLSNAGYTLDTALETAHAGFCRIEVIGERGWLLCPLGEASIGVYDLRRTGDQLLATLSVPSATAEGSNNGNGSGNGTASATGACTGALMCLKYVPIGGRDFVLGCYESGDFCTWEVCGGGSARLVDRQRLDECPMAVDYDAHTNRGLWGGPSDRLGVFAYDRVAMRLQRRGEIAMKTAGVNCVRIRSSDRRVFSVGGWDGHIRVYSWSSLRPLAVLTEHRTAVADIAYSTGKVSLWDAPVMAAAGQDGHISLWDLYN